MKTEQKPSERHLLREWTPYAQFRNWIHSRQYCDDLANEDNGFQWRIMQRDGWYVVERMRWRKDDE